MDLAGGTLYYKGVKIIHQVETGGSQEDTSKTLSFLLPPNKLKCAVKMVERFTEPLCPFTTETTVFGGDDWICV
jgi:hypothetical protein